VSGHDAPGPEALDAARRHQARSHDLRAITALTWRSTGRRADARARLTEVYRWFTEGFGSRDLTAARAQIDEPSAPPSSQRAPGRSAPPG
jgi:hypothetical protein